MLEKRAMGAGTVPVGAPGGVTLALPPQIFPIQVVRSSFHAG